MSHSSAPSRTTLTRSARPSSPAGVAHGPRRVVVDAQSAVASSALLDRKGKLWITHEGEQYLLRRTSNNRLILTK